MNLTEHLRRAIADSPLSIDGRSLFANLSIGVAQLHRHESADALLKRADNTPYPSKTRGRGRVSRAWRAADAMP